MNNGGRDMTKSQNAYVEIEASRNDAADTAIVGVSMDAGLRNKLAQIVAYLIPQIRHQKWVFIFVEWIFGQERLR